MADVRALLKAKRQEAKITHPLASYSSSGQLRCSACGTAIKHASAWEGHVGSKAHRTTVSRLKEEASAREKQRLAQELEEQERIKRGKRKMDDDVQDVDAESTKRAKVASNAGHGFPSDFFSDPARAPVPTGYDDDDEDEEPPANSALHSTTNAPPADALDAEWQRFQRDVVNGPDHRETYDNATVMAEPMLIDPTEGIPTTASERVAEDPSQLEEEEQRRQKEHDERELIMDRLMEEEQAQEEADLRAISMKNKIAALKQKREAAKSAKPRS